MRCARVPSHLFCPVAYAPARLLDASQTPPLSRANIAAATCRRIAQRRRIEAERRTLQFRLDEALAFVDLEVAVGGSLELAPEPPVVPSTTDRLARRDDSTGDRR